MHKFRSVLIDRVHDRCPPKMIILDMDSSVSPTHGEQEGTAYNGHFGCTCYHHHQPERAIWGIPIGVARM